MGFSFIISVAFLTIIPVVYILLTIFEAVINEESLAMHDRIKRVLNAEQQDFEKHFQSYKEGSQQWCFCGTKSWLNFFMITNPGEFTYCSEKRSYLSGDAKLKNKFLYYCMFEELHLINQEGTIKREETIDLFMKKVFIEPSIKSTAKVALDLCMPKPGFLGYISQDESKKMMDPFSFLVCLLERMLELCPAELKMDKDPFCQKIYKGFGSLDKSGAQKAEKEEKIYLSDVL